MAGSDVAVTDATVADLVLEYAMHLGRVGTTDIVSVPVPDSDDTVAVDLLLGPSSQIVLSIADVEGTLDPERSASAAADLRTRIERVTDRSARSIAADDQLDPLDAFVDFDGYDADQR
jgi:hypothetical protein